MNVDDHQHMARAMQLARHGLYTTDPNPRVGCVLIKDGREVGKGFHLKAGEPHAERLALMCAGVAARGATAYVTLEPCCHYGRTPPCTAALIEAGVSRVVIAMQDPNPQVRGKGIQQLREAGIQVEVGLLEDAARSLNPGFIRRMQIRRPYVRLKLAMSLDGRTAMANGESQWITGSAARLDVHRLRARSSAIVTGIDTVLADDPSMTVRLPFDEIPGVKQAADIRQPLRVVLDSQGRIPKDANLFAQMGTTLVMHGEQIQPGFEQADVESLPMPLNAQGRIDLTAVLENLVQREINEVLLECGPTLAGSALQAGLIDELVVYMAPSLLGDAARGLVKLPGMQHLSEKIDMELQDTRQIGRDLRLTFGIKTII